MDQCVRQIADADLARGQQAKSLGLRAATSIARLSQLQGRHEEARTVLAPIVGWFTEGFDSPDLKDAAAQFASLGCQL